MAYNLELEDRIGEVIAGWTGVVRKKMFGGVCYLMRGNMGFGIWKDHLIVRTGPDLAEKFLSLDGIRPFDVTGRAMKGWVMVDGNHWEDTEELKTWLNRGRDFALTLPAK